MLYKYVPADPSGRIV